MLLFIGTLNPWTTGTMVFQYISCYSLSNAESGIHFHAHAFQYISCYSLSEKGTTFVPSVDTFQYISCYSLSARQAEYEHMRFTFQYISCYSLSVIREKRAWMAPVSIHLMLLFIRDKIKISFDGRLVSIHLMLLFICAAATKLKDWVVFQYISCYSLSGTSTHKTVRIPRFNTSHVTLYRRCLLERKQD